MNSLIAGFIIGILTMCFGGAITQITTEGFIIMPVGSIVARTDEGFLVTTPSGLTVPIKNRTDILTYLELVE